MASNQSRPTRPSSPHPPFIPSNRKISPHQRRDGAQQEGGRGRRRGGGAAGAHPRAPEGERQLLLLVCCASVGVDGIGIGGPHPFHSIHPSDGRPYGPIVIIPSTSPTNPDQPPTPKAQGLAKAAEALQKEGKLAAVPAGGVSLLELYKQHRPAAAKAALGLSSSDSSDSSDSDSSSSDEESEVSVCLCLACGRLRACVRRFCSFGSG